MASTEFVDPYLDRETGLLRNLVGARDNAALVAAEGALVFARAVQLLDRPPKPTSDLTELCAIHRLLFQDLFAWAGQIRTVDIRKKADNSGFFLPASIIERAAGFAAEELHKDNGLRGLGRDQFIERLAYHYDSFNYIHPFREGNGRTQRVFWSRIARDAGWQLDWRPVQGAVNDEASRAGHEDSELQPLREMFDLVVSHRAGDTDSATWSTAEQERLGVARPGSTDDDTGSTQHGQRR